MESGQLEIGGTAKNLMGAYPAVANPSIPVAQEEHYGSPKVAPQLASPAKKRTSTVDSHFPIEKNTHPSVSNCYFFKSRLQEYAQKAGIRTPVYETIKEGPSHEPSFRSTVIVNDVRYDSLPGFSNRKAAEQSAAEVALMELANLVDMKFGISQPVHDTGLCKNLLQEYAQKMNYAIPLYECHLDNQSGKKPMYSCVLDIGGIKYIGASASTKKEAEIKVARTALLAIKSTTSAFEDEVGYHTVVPHKKKVTDLGISTQETAAALKPKKGRFKKQWKKKRAIEKCNFIKGKMAIGLEANLNCQTRVESAVTGAVNSQHIVVTDNLEVNMDRQEVLQASVADAVSSIVETPVDSHSQIETPVTHMGMPVSEIETPAVSHIETPVGSGVANADSFQEPDSGLALSETMSRFTRPETCNNNLEKPVVSSDEGLRKDGGSASTYVEP
ncbi:double-stranded RNA-binding protein 3-like isoform X1 [Primulina eburnea]|uniref:double-stranded RNA-binding protein 3-like isoform X1 n=1 Tax=Primulina eburnea TaxID=1245227 RepID=UPI003C6C98DA